MNLKRNCRINGLYAITPDEPDTFELLRKVRLALQGGAHVLQYRNKISGRAVHLEQALALREMTKEFDVPLIVNDDVLLAKEVEADGVHLGSKDGNLSDARLVLGDFKLIGMSCYNRLSLAREAVNAGADYVAFGSFFDSRIKPDAVTAPQDLLRQARREFSVPLVAIGGINVENSSQLLDSGASALAVITDVFGAQDIQGRARQFANIFDTKH